MLLLDSFPVDALPPEGCVLVFRPASPDEVRKALRSRECTSAISTAELASAWTELLETHVSHAPLETHPLKQPVELLPGTCHYLVSAGNVFHLSARRV